MLNNMGQICYSILGIDIRRCTAWLRRNRNSIESKSLLFKCPQWCTRIKVQHVQGIWHWAAGYLRFKVSSISCISPQHHAPREEFVDSNLASWKKQSARSAETTRRGTSLVQFYYLVYRVYPRECQQSGKERKSRVFTCIEYSQHILLVWHA